MPLPVSDIRANRNENIDHAARSLGRSKHRRMVFDKIYFGKKAVKTVQDIADKTDLSRKQVLMAAKKLVDDQLVDQTRKDGDTAYRKVGFFHKNKAEILRCVDDPRKLARLPTKRNPSCARAQTVSIRLPSRPVPVVRITVDDIDSFNKVARVAPGPMISRDVSESRFKNGVKKILGQRGDFKDWAGEKNDLYTSFLRIDGRRYQCAFAFKGPGTRGKLVPAKLGRKGDQIQKLFESTAQVFFIQYCGEIDASVIDQMDALARAKSTLNGDQSVWYGVIDGQDSNRLYEAYPHAFAEQ